MSDEMFDRPRVMDSQEFDDLESKAKRAKERDSDWYSEELQDGRLKATVADVLGEEDYEGFHAYTRGNPEEGVLYALMAADARAPTSMVRFLRRQMMDQKAVRELHSAALPKPKHRSVMDKLMKREPTEE